MSKKPQKATIPSCTFCVLPWVHLEIQQDGSVFPCCLGQHHTPLGNIKHDSTSDIWNGEAQKKLRLDMLHGKRNSYCNYCYELEDKNSPSPRHKHNEHFQDIISNVQSLTTATGTCEKVDLRYIGIRFSNLCNLKCSYCSDRFSTKWYTEARQAIRSFAKFGDATNFVTDNLSTLGAIYIAGGEPLLDKENELLLQTLIDNNRTDITLIYNTNFTVVTDKLLDLWSNFKQIFIDASIDSCNPINNTIRLHSSIDAINSNIERVQKLKNITVRLYPTITLLNIFDLHETLEFYMDKFSIHPKHIDLNILTSPEVLSISRIPSIYRENIRRNILNLMKTDSLSKYSFTDSLKLTRQLQNILNILSTDQDSFSPNELINFLKDYSNLDESSLSNTFTFLKDLK